VRVVGGFTEHQFVEKRLPTLAELNAVAPDTRSSSCICTTEPCSTPPPCAPWATPRTRPSRPAADPARQRRQPTGLLLAKPNASILYATLAKGPKLPRDYQVNSTRHFMRELNRLGVTGAIDAGGGMQNYPDDYDVIQELADADQLTIRLAYNLFTQKPKEEKDDFLRWTATSQYKQGDDYFRHNGAGEMLVFSAADFEDFRQPRPSMAPGMEGELEEVVRILAQNRWPWRMHATYDETIDRALDVFEKVNRDTPLTGLNWFFDHAETISEKSIDRIAALGGGVAVQHRMAYQGEYFVERYGAARPRPRPRQAHAGKGRQRVSRHRRHPRRQLQPLGLAVLADHGQDRGRPAAHPQRNCLSRDQACAWDRNVTWFSNEQGKKGRIQVGQLADLIVPDRDFFACPESDIADTSALLTVVGGKVVYGAGAFADFDESAPPLAMPDWSPVRTFKGYGAWGVQEGARRCSP
jgi:predicted amidohydrolase YtcJ